jgi:hypothetical protein
MLKIRNIYLMKMDLIVGLFYVYMQRKKNRKYKKKYLSDNVICPICMEYKVCIVFSCTHVCCCVCANKITNCHICRRLIKNKMLFILP